MATPIGHLHSIEEVNEWLFNGMQMVARCDRCRCVVHDSPEWNCSSVLAAVPPLPWVFTMWTSLMRTLATFINNNKISLKELQCIQCLWINLIYGTYISMNEICSTLYSISSWWLCPQWCISVFLSYQHIADSVQLNENEGSARQSPQRSDRAEKWVAFTELFFYHHSWGILWLRTYLLIIYTIQSHVPQADHNQSIDFFFFYKIKWNLLYPTRDMYHTSMFNPLNESLKR